MDKPTKPTDLMPRSFGGVKNNFSATLQTNGYEDGVPAIFGGDNLNYMLNSSGKELDYCEKFCDFINTIPIGNTLVIDSNNKITYTPLPKLYSSTGSNTDGAMTQDASTSAFMSIDADNISTTGEKVFDGTLTSASGADWNVVSNLAMNGGSTPYAQDISSLLPNDTADYLCLFTGRTEPYNYASRTSILAIKNSLDNKFTWVCSSIAYDTNAKPPGYGAVWIKIPYSDRKVYIYRNTSTNYSGATLNLGLVAYRRIGTNS